MKLSKIVETMVAAQEGEDEAYARAAVNPITCQDMLETQLGMRRLSFKTMLVYYAAFFIIGLLELVNQFASKHPSPNIGLAGFGFLALSGNLSFLHADMKVKMLKALRATQMQPQVLESMNRL